MTLRAINVLKTADLILAEDTRTSSVLLHHFGIENHLLSHHKFNEHQTVQNLIQKLEGSMTIAMISDAGTPSISDPGFLLVRECVHHDIEVQTLPGPTALIPALVSSGLPSDRFCFEGFLPLKKGRASRLEILAKEERTMIFYESPHRLVKTLQQFLNFFGAERPVSVSREISKIYEETVRGTLSEVTEHFLVNEPRGEFVIVVGGCLDKVKSTKKSNQSTNKYKKAEP